MSKREQLAKAFDSSSMSGKLIDLNEEQATEFFTIVEDESQFLKKVRTHLTTKPTGTLGKLTADGNFLVPGTYSSKNATDYEFGATPVEYVTKLVRGSFTVYDSEIRNNVEGEGLETKLLSVIAKKVANDYEQMAFYGRKRSSPVTILEMMDGIIFKGMENGVLVNAADSALFSDRYVAREKFRKVQKGMKSILRKDAEWFVSPDVMMDYEDLYATVADYQVRQELQTRIAKRPANECSILTDDSAVLKSGGASTTVASASAPINTAGQKKIEVASATGISVGDVLSINLGLETEQTRTVTDVTSTTITFDEDLLYAVSVSDTVKEVTEDGADCVFTEPMNVIRIQQVGRGSMTFEAERIASVGRRWHYVGNVDMVVLHDEKLGILKNVKVK